MIHLFLVVVYILQKTNIWQPNSLKASLCPGRSQCWTLVTSQQILMTLIRPLPLPLLVEIVSVVIVDVIIIIIVIFVNIIKGKGKGSTATLRHRKLSGHSTPSGHCFTELATVLLKNCIFTTQFIPQLIFAYIVLYCSSQCGLQQVFFLLQIIAE